MTGYLPGSGRWVAERPGPLVLLWPFLLHIYTKSCQLPQLPPNVLKTLLAKLSEINVCILESLPFCRLPYHQPPSPPCNAPVALLVSISSLTTVYLAY